MTTRRLAVFGALALVALSAAVLLANQRSATTRSQDELLYPQLKAQADSVNAIRIFQAGDVRTIELVRDGTEWMLTERHNHPAAAIKARRLVQALADAKILEEKTSDPEKYATLSVDDVQNADAKGIRIELEGPASVVHLIVGKDGPGGKSSYVRRAGEARSWLVDQQLSASPEVRDWLDKDILNVSADRIQSATVSIQGQKPYTAAKSSRADADFNVAPLPKGKQLISSGAANSAATALSHLSLDDVQPKAQIATGKPAAHATFKTFDGLVVQIEGHESDGKHYLVLSPSYDAALAEQFRLKTAPPAEGGNADAAAPAANVEEEAGKSATKLALWAYEVPQYKYEGIFRPLDEMLKK